MSLDDTQPGAVSQQSTASHTLASRQPSAPARRLAAFVGRCVWQLRSKKAVRLRVVGIRTATPESVEKTTEAVPAIHAARHRHQTGRNDKATKERVQGLLLPWDLHFARRKTAFSTQLFCHVAGTRDGSWDTAQGFSPIPHTFSRRLPVRQKSDVYASIFFQQRTQSTIPCRTCS